MLEMDLATLGRLPALPTAAQMAGIKYWLTEVYVPETGPVEAVKQHKAAIKERPWTRDESSRRVRPTPPNYS